MYSCVKKIEIGYFKTKKILQAKFPNAVMLIVEIHLH